MIILGIGCNLGDRLTNLRQALKHINNLERVVIKQVSPIYESDALLPDNAPKNWQHSYLNLAIDISTKLTPDQLIIKLKNIEKKMGREDKHQAWSPRIIDIDILVWNEECYCTDNLNIPHTGLLNRPFALWPLADLVPNWKYCRPNQPQTNIAAKELIKKFGSRFDGGAPLHTKQIAHRADTPMVMGIVNATPDSFSDGGMFTEPDIALQHAEALVNSGADIIDLGAESTRPYVTKIVTAKEEWKRLKPILELWHKYWANKSIKPKLSIDTRKPEIVKKLLSYNIDFLNDVSGMTNPKMIALAKYSHAKVIFMHNLCIPANPKQVLSQNTCPILEIYTWGKQQLKKLTKAGITKDRLIFDVGIGFGKDADQSLEVIKNIAKFHELNIPILVGHSRKSFLNQFTNKPYLKRDLETSAVSMFLAKQGIEYLRLHNVEQFMRLFKTDAALRSPVLDRST